MMDPLPRPARRRRKAALGDRDSLSVPSWEALIARVHADAGHLHSEIHGDEHWRAVAAAGRLMCSYHPGADLTTVMLFALFHDSMRKHDGEDLIHGRLAARYLTSIAAEGLFTGEQGAVKRLSYAAALHSDGEVEERDATIACCWDADRLNLWRVGIRPSPLFLSTDVAKDSGIITWARTLHATAPTWSDVLSPDFRPESVGGDGELPDLVATASASRMEF